MSRDQILSDLDKYWNSVGNDAEHIKKTLVDAGAPCREVLKEIACDRGAELNTRKTPVVLIAASADSEAAAFLAKNFVIGKDAGALYEAFENGKRWQHYG